MHDPRTPDTTRSRRSTRRRAQGAVMAGLLLGTIGLAGCGDDDKASDEGSSATTVPKEAANAAFCDDVLAADTYFNSLEGPPDAAKVDELISAVEDSAPDELTEQVSTVATETRASAETGEDTSEAFDAAYAEVGAWTGENCGYEHLELTAKEYEFGNVPETAPAGVTSVSLENEGMEMHETVIVRINDDVTESLEEIAALPEEEAMSKITVLGHTFAAPGETGSGTAAMEEPGRYGVVCFIPQGMTPEAMAAAEASGTEPEGAPHFTLGMVSEFEVK